MERREVRKHVPTATADFERGGWIELQNRFVEDQVIIVQRLHLILFY